VPTIKQEIMKLSVDMNHGFTPSAEPFIVEISHAMAENKKVV